MIGACSERIFISSGSDVLYVLATDVDNTRITIRVVGLKSLSISNVRPSGNDLRNVLGYHITDLINMHEHP